MAMREGPERWRSTRSMAAAHWPGGYLGFIGGLLLGRTSREIDATS